MHALYSLSDSEGCSESLLLLSSAVSSSQSGLLRFFSSLAGRERALCAGIVIFLQKPHRLPVRSILCRAAHALSREIGSKMCGPSHF